MKLKLYIIKRTDKVGYDEYRSLVVCAQSKRLAKGIKPESHEDTWAHSNNIEVEFIGYAARGMEPGIIHKNFNNG